MGNRLGKCFSCIDNTLALLPQFNHSTSNATRQLYQIENIQDISDLTLREVSIMSSHNTYIRTIQHLSKSTVKGIDIALKLGSRCIELDIYRHKNTNSVYVAHGKPSDTDIITTTHLALSDAFKYIKENAFKYTSDPLFIALELNIHNEESASDIIADLIQEYFGDIIYNQSVTLDTKIKDLTGKVVFMSGGGSKGKLSSLIHIQWSDIFPNLASDVSPLSFDGRNTCARIYPVGSFKNALSNNFDSIPFLKSGATFVAMNVARNDIHMKNYIRYFLKSSFVKKPV